MSSVPALFVSHGAPTLILETVPARAALRDLGRRLGRPRAVVVASAHWEQAASPLTGATAPETIHDFHGFPQRLYELRYPAPGDPDLAAEASALLEAAGIASGVDGQRGLDHGAWVPLMLMYPDADVPVLQVAVSPQAGAAHHLRLGAALAPLRARGVLVMGSGSATHDLRAFRGQPIDAPAPEWVSGFNEWLAEAVARGDVGALRDYRDAHPHAARNHPTEEHYLPLLVAAGAGGGPGERVHHSYTYGVLSMDAYLFH